ncbi:GNAT family N-acetyltransferase [Aurantimonas sp. VKM B-3413]|uniref:GNAT family N-acetyltransferase n=1 Tax=Aurantimonas sp. VKM B-3413 TaxID=2779401 RepID=UPI001E43D080|nr:GNAT family N-acetyltransferase [Aurantimonas sp. VKM B-3413]MCB8837699.1 GNAT family N-acetyltransferase [Aurantimonas sp. VKM B-3413]
MTPTIERLELADTDLRARIVAPLAEYSTRKDFAFTPRYVTLALKDENGVDGGLIGQVYWGWMHIEILAVPQRWRGRGLGRALIEQAEAIAAEAGCTGVWVDTYSFQSPGFYEAVGYLPFGRLADYPEGEERIFFQKILSAAALPAETETAA